VNPLLKLFVFAQAFAADAAAELRRREEGQTMAEYGVVLAVITVGVVAAIGLLAVAIAGKLGAVTKVLTG
jgi:Flp pilus assembly pilin Flp